MAIPVSDDILYVTWAHATTGPHGRLSSELSVTCEKAGCRQEHRTGGLHLAYEPAASCFCSFLIHTEVTTTLKDLVLQCVLTSLD